MSYRDVRAFVETMKTLGYPRLISVDNFRAPNFELVADCLHWLVHRLQPDCQVRSDIGSEAERVRFLQAVAQVALSQARLRLNLRRLYAADGSAVRELAKLAALLAAADRAAEQADDEAAPLEGVAGAKDLDVGAVRAAAADMVSHGAALHAALAAEAGAGGLAAARAAALAAAPEPQQVEAAVGEAAAQVQDALRRLAGALADVAASEAGLAEQLERRRGEVARAEKRAAALAGVRPAYLDDAARLQEELGALWAGYLERSRNLAYLEAQLGALAAAEAGAAAAAEKRLHRMQRRFAEAELRMLRGEAAADGDDLAAAGAWGAAGGGSSRSGSESDASEEGAGQAGGQRGGMPGWAWTRHAGAGVLAPGQVVGSLDGGDEEEGGAGGSSGGDAGSGSEAAVSVGGSEDSAF